MAPVSFVRKITLPVTPISAFHNNATSMILLLTDVRREEKRRGRGF